ncbi:MAG: PilZ domain-containing protein [Desulfobacterales bacterium]|nr:PilZ domain-containing protein [Desulfobacteraceae bacterium]MBT7086023.1 PilZ domain-containing protein [Desulfobacterales bacterium]
MTIEDRRKNTRNNLSIPANVKGPKGVIEAVGKDISIDGVKIETSKPLNPGTTVEVFLDLNDPILLEGLVVWKKKEDRDDESVFVMGIQVYAIIHDDVKAMSFPDKFELFNELMERLGE